jgi:hypothetical protein
VTTQWVDQYRDGTTFILDCNGLLLHLELNKRGLWFVRCPEMRISRQLPSSSAIDAQRLAAAMLRNSLQVTVDSITK